jgi:hypothetical protein
VDKDDTRLFLNELREVGCPVSFDYTIMALGEYAETALDAETDEALLEADGWTVECKSPFEIRHKDGSFATGQAADAVVFTLRYG